MRTVVPYDEALYHLRMTEEQARLVAERVRTICRQVAVDSYERALADGLCAEGAFEVAMDAIQSLDINALLRKQQPVPQTE